jgi:hypothetical protein
MLAANHQATFTVERPDGTKSRVRADQLLFNAALRYMQDHPRAQPKECTCTTPHDALLCTFVHFRRVYSIQLRDGSNLLCESAELHPGRAVTYLDRHPTAFAKECTNTELHDAGSCSFIHFTSAMQVKCLFHFLRMNSGGDAYFMSNRLYLSIHCRLGP